MEVSGPRGRAVCRNPGLRAPPRGVPAGAGAPAPAASGTHYCSAHPAGLPAVPILIKVKMPFLFLKLEGEACQVYKTIKTTNTQVLPPNFLREHQQVPFETMLILRSWAASCPEEEVTDCSLAEHLFLCLMVHGTASQCLPQHSQKHTHPAGMDQAPEQHLPARGNQKLFFLPSTQSSGIQDSWVFYWCIYKNELAKHELFHAVRLLWGREREQ